MVDVGGQRREPGSLHVHGRLRRYAINLAWATIAWNSIEAVVAILSGRAANSIALVGFGLNSIVEVGSAFVVLWQFAGVGESRERRALRLIAISFFVFGAYICAQSFYDLVTRSAPEESTFGIALAVASLLVMPALAAAKRRVGRSMSSSTVIADSAQTELCAYLSAVLLVGLLLNSALGWWWADPFAALFISGLAFREGREAWQGETCDGCAG